MEEVSSTEGTDFAKIIEEDEDVPINEMCLFNGCQILHKGTAVNSTWICIKRLRGG